VQHIYLDAIPGEALSLMLEYMEKTDWPTDTAAAPTILQRNLSLVKAQTMMIAARDLPDDRLQAVFGPALQQALEMGRLEAQRFEYAHQNRLAMGQSRG
jgi:hypothetical protein